jgi:hypothetical protein
MRLPFVFLIVACSSSLAHAAGFKSGNSLLAECSVQRDDATYYQSNASCVSYIVGVTDLILLQQQMTDANGQPVRQYICVPSQVEAGQVRDITVQYITNNPDKRHFQAAALVWNALGAAFPCRS